MPDCFLCLAALGVIRDTETNNVSVFSILEELGAQGFPFLIQEMGVLAMWRRSTPDEGAVDLQFRVLNNDTQLYAGPVRVAFAQAERHRSIVRLGGLLIREPGNLRFGFFHGNEELASYTVRIKEPQTTVTAVPEAGTQEAGA